MIKKLLLIVGLLPVCYIIDFFNGSNWSESYLDFLMLYWDVIIVVLLGYYFFNKNKAYQYEVNEELRASQFFHEINRYNGSPYIAPLLLLYLKNPPGSTYPTDYAYVNDTFYRTVMNVFRDRIYILQEISMMEPYKRGNYTLEVFGVKRLGLMVFYMAAPFIWYGFVKNGLNLSLLNDWPVLTLPLLLVSFQRVAYLLKAYILYIPSKLDGMLQENECNLNATWRDAFPDREIGITFLRAYYFELEKRQRYEMTLQGKKIPDKYPLWTNGNFAPFPYPSSKMPTWENQYESYLEEKKIEKMSGTVNLNKNVVAFPSTKKY